ncbi:MAG: hypothetical protein PUD44_08690 [Clostridiaceae bacterium]|nr:hypothetical protein [Clostridiaceae bacterium]
MEREIRLKFPLPRPHCGLPLANGNLGLLLWGDRALHITVNESDLWDHRCGERLVPGTSYAVLTQTAKQYGCGAELERKILREVDSPFRPQRIPVGRIELSFREGVRPEEAVLCYETGEAEVRLSDGTALTVFVSLDKNAAFIEDPAQRITSVLCRPSWDFPKSREWLASCGYRPPARFPDGFRIDFPDAADGCAEVRCRKTAYGYVLSVNGAEDSRESARRTAGAFWKAFWRDIPELAIPDPFYSRFFTYNIYKFAAATHPNGYPAGLQGPWHEEYQKAQWSGDYHFNVNVQMIYGAALSLGKPAHLLPLFDMIESVPFWENLRHNARVLFGIEDGLWFTHAVDDRGFQCGGLSCGAVLDPACGAWTALLYDGYWRLTGDEAFLRKRAYPFVYGVMRCYEEMLDGDFSIPAAVSAEYASSNEDADRAGRNPSYQLAAMHRLADILLEMSAALGTEPRPVWREIQRRLPPYTTVEAFEHYAGKVERRIGIWEGQDLAHCHRHHSHLGCIYPFDSLPETPDAEQQEIVDASVDHWIALGEGQWSEWCYPWAWCILTRMGLREAPAVMMDVWRAHFVNEGLCTVYLPRFRGMIAHRRMDIGKPRDENEIMQLDGAMGYVTALLDMFAYRKGDTLYLFRGVPESWKEAAMENVPLPGGLRVTAKRGGKVTVTGPREQTLRVWMDGRTEECRIEKDS